MASSDCPTCEVPMKRCGKVYECSNCSFERPIRAYNTRKGVMTPTQEAEIEAVKVRFWARVTMGAILGPECEAKYEWKEFKHELLDWGAVSLVMEIGMKNDEGKLSSLLCRYRVHIFIGRKGRLFAYGKGGKKLEGDDTLWAHLH